MILLKKDVWVRLDSSQALGWLTSTKFCLRLWRFLLLFTWLLVLPESFANKMYDKNTLISTLKDHEGSKYNANKQMISYYDSEDHLTVGYGHKVLPGDKDMYGNPIVSKEQVISQQQADEWFKKDTERSIRQATSIPGFDRMSPSRQIAMIDLTFNMGFGWTTEFKNAYKLIKSAALSTNEEQRNNLWNWASNEIKYKDGRDLSKGNSDYWNQTKRRAVNIVGMIKDG